MKKVPKLMQEFIGQGDDQAEKTDPQMEAGQGNPPPDIVQKKQNELGGTGKRPPKFVALRNTSA